MTGLRWSSGRRLHSLLLVAAAAVALSLSACGTQSTVYVFPIPGSQVASPGSQITFRGIPTDGLGSLTVSGSRSGKHPGRVASHSDGHGASFLPSARFSPGEVVTVRTSLKIARAHAGVFRFRIATAADVSIQGPPPSSAPRPRGDLQQFRSAPTLSPEAVRVLSRSGTATAGDIFVAPQGGPGQSGPMILDPAGSLLWFKPVAAGTGVDNFSVQSYHGHPVLTWWQGHMTAAGWGLGEDVIMNSGYQQVATVRAGNGLSADLHEFQLTPRNTALISSYYPVRWDTSSVGGSRRGVVLDNVVQEIDIPTGLVLFQWDSLDHVPLSEAQTKPPDYFHVNSIQEQANGDLLISARNTWAGYLVDHRSGDVRWRLGGKRSSFRLGPGSTFAFQHDLRLQGSSTLTLFDDGAGPPTIHQQSRALTLSLNWARRTAVVRQQLTHAPALLANFEGNRQSLADGHSFIGWGQPPYFSEYDARGHPVFDARFVDDLASYRAFRQPWSGSAPGRPSVATTRQGKTTTVYVSWNGSSDTVKWRVRAGSSPTALRTVATASRSGFETAIAVPGAGAYVAVEALRSDGGVLGRSAPVRVY